MKTPREYLDEMGELPRFDTNEKITIDHALHLCKMYGNYIENQLGDTATTMDNLKTLASLENQVKDKDKLIANLTTALDVRTDELNQSREDNKRLELSTAELVAEVSKLQQRVKLSEANYGKLVDEYNNTAIGEQGISLDEPTSSNDFEDLNDPLTRQAGGDHYLSYKIQPAEFFAANGTPYLEATACNYVLRHKDKGGAEDLDKAIHTIELIKTLS